MFNYLHTIGGHGHRHGHHHGHGHGDGVAVQIAAKKGQQTIIVSNMCLVIITYIFK